MSVLDLPFDAQAPQDDGGAYEPAHEETPAPSAPPAEGGDLLLGARERMVLARVPARGSTIAYDVVTLPGPGVSRGDAQAFLFGLAMRQRVCAWDEGVGLHLVARGPLCPLCRRALSLCKHEAIR